jgi:predicted DNA-binding transcriptional regulator AlpA
MSEIYSNAHKKIYRGGGMDIDKKNLIDDAILDAAKLVGKLVEEITVKEINSIIKDITKDIPQNIESKPVPVDDDRFLRSDEVMQYFNNISKPTLYRYIKKGIIPKPTYMGKSPVWKLKDLKETLENLPSSPPFYEKKEEISHPKS